MKYKFIIFNLLLLFTLLPKVASAHESLLGSLDGVIEGSKIRMLYILPEKRTLSDEQLFRQYLKDAVKIKNNNQDCDVDLTEYKETDPSEIVVEASCPDAIENLSINHTFFSDIGYNFSSVFSKDDIKHTYTFDGSNSTAEFTVTPPTAEEKLAETLQTVKDFTKLGMEHIFTGYDHILFVIALIIVIIKPRQIIKTITAFTIAHSVTLILSTYDLVYISPKLVEPLIALSIAYVAIEDVLLRNYKKFKKDAGEIVSKRWQAAFGFGLFHGLGFAGILKEIDIPEGLQNLSLVAFNLGVEIGQLIIIVLSLPVLYFISKLSIKNKISTTGSVLIGIIGIIWFFERVLA